MKSNQGFSRIRNDQVAFSYIASLNEASYLPFSALLVEEEVEPTSGAGGRFSFLAAETSG